MNYAHKHLLCALTAASSLIVTASAHAATLLGSTVTATLAYPTIGSIVGGPTSEVVGVSSPTFPAGSIPGTTLFTLDVTANQIIGRPLTDAAYGTAPFNGVIFAFSNAPKITNVTVDASSTYFPMVTFTDNMIYESVSGITVNPTDFTVLDVTLASVPEPAAWALMLLGMGTVGFAMRCRRNGAVALA